LLTKGMEHIKGFLARLSMRHASPTVLCRVAGDRVFRQNRSDMSMTGKAHLLLDRGSKVLNQMEAIGHLPGLGCALPGGPWA
ncbi:hypothetical protein GA0061102_103858, partial [Rhizobium miluonense]